MAAALTEVGWHPRPILGRSATPAEVAAAAAGVDLVLIATPDSAVAEVSAAIEPAATAAVAHLAGSLGLGAVDTHPRPAALHPLVALPDAAVGARRLRAGGWFAVGGAIRSSGRSSPIWAGGRSRWPTPTGPPTTRPRWSPPTIWWRCSARPSASLRWPECPSRAFMDLVRATVAQRRRVGSGRGPHRSRGPGRHRNGQATSGSDRPGRAVRLRGAVPASPPPRRPGMSIGRPAPECEATIRGLRVRLAEARAAGRTVGFVPTMGFLHAGHCSLVERGPGRERRRGGVDLRQPPAVQSG